MNDTLQRELRLLAWILQDPKERHPIIERHMNHGAVIETPFPPHDVSADRGREG